MSVIVQLNVTRRANIESRDAIMFTYVVEYAVGVSGLVQNIARCAAVLRQGGQGTSFHAKNLLVSSLKLSNFGSVG